MKVGIAGPVSLRLLKGFEHAVDMPVGYEHPPMSALVNGLLDRGLPVTVFTSSPGLTKPAVWEAGGLTVCIARRERQAARELFRTVRRELVGLMKEYPTDIVNAHWTYEFAWASLESGIPALVTVRDHAGSVLRYSRSAYWLVRLLINHYVLNRAQYLSTNSAYLQSKLAPRHQRKSRVTSNFYSRELPGYAKENVRKENHIICIANGFGKLKNVASAIVAFGHIRKRFPGMTLKLIGYEMGVGEPAQAYADKIGKSEGIEFLGRLPHRNVLELLRQAKVMVHPSLEESFGMSVLESMVLGTPVVGGARSGNIPGLLEGGKVGVLCDVSHPDEVAAAVCRILENAEDAGKLADAAASRAMAYYSQDAAISRYIEYFENIIASNASGGRKSNRIVA